MTFWLKWLMTELVQWYDVSICRPGVGWILQRRNTVILQLLKSYLSLIKFDTPIHNANFNTGLISTDNGRNQHLNEMKCWQSHMIDSTLFQVTVYEWNYQRLLKKKMINNSCIGQSLSREYSWNLIIIYCSLINNCSKAFCKVQKITEKCILSGVFISGKLLSKCRLLDRGWLQLV